MSEVMSNTAMAAGAASDGFLILDSSMHPLFVNSAAAKILAYPRHLGTEEDLNAYVADTIRSRLLLQKPARGAVVVSKFNSGRRQYFCRAFRVNGIEAGGSEASYAVILERGSGRSANILQLQERFNLTTREREVTQFLLEGLTSKEIGARLQISPNTVKMFLRLIMMKMGVSTRAAIVSKALTMEP
jgi:DNA-binding CsgD family transcriptional regulator